MNFTVPLALFGWPVVALILCALLKPRRAVIAAYIAAWLFLPVYAYKVPGFPDWTKMTATSTSLFLGLLLFDLRTITAFRPRLFDLPMAVWCLCPIATSLSNNLGLYDGISSCLDQTVTWGIPYLLGRLYFSDVDHLRELAWGLFIGGVAYVPFCLYEIRLSPQLHNLVYGYHQHSFAQTARFGGWRPTVFMDHGLMVGMWMAMSTLAGLWLWFSGAIRSIRGISVLWFLVPLAVTTVLCKSAGALLILIFGLLALAWARRIQTRLAILVLGAVAPLYILVRLTGIWSGAELVDVAAMASEERAGSLALRLVQEDLLSEKAMKQPVFGWGGWGRSRIRDEGGKDIVATDGMWVLELGYRGLVGLAAMLTVFLLPAVALVRRIPASDWTRPWAAPAAALAVVVLLYLLDCIPNSHITPVYFLATGGLTGLLAWSYPIQELETEVEKAGPSGS